jgi:hypothetical protein
MTKWTYTTRLEEHRVDDREDLVEQRVRRVSESTDASRTHVHRSHLVGHHDAIDTGSWWESDVERVPPIGARDGTHHAEPRGALEEVVRHDQRGTSTVLLVGP